MDTTKHITRVSVRSIVENGEGRVLVIRRSNTRYGKGKWCLPGGKVDFGVPVMENLAKELQEETSLELTDATFLFWLDVLPSEETDLHFITLLFRCQATGEVKLNAESVEHTWISPDELNQYPFAFDNDLALKRYWGGEEK